MNVEHTRREPREAQSQRRWAHMLGFELALLGVCLAALFGSGIGWFVLPALLAVPIGGSLAIVYLAMSSDTNDRARKRS